jgi:hypothetical protein
MSIKPLALSDTQLDIVFRLAAPLLAADRSAFLEDGARGSSADCPRWVTASSPGPALRCSGSTGARPSSAMAAPAVESTARGSIGLVTPGRYPEVGDIANTLI